MLAARGWVARAAQNEGDTLEDGVFRIGDQGLEHSGFAGEVAIQRGLRYPNRGGKFGGR